MDVYLVKEWGLKFTLNAVLTVLKVDQVGCFIVTLYGQTSCGYKLIKCVAEMSQVGLMEPFGGWIPLPQTTLKWFTIDNETGQRSPVCTETWKELLLELCD